MEKMTLELGDVEETALIPVAIKASESLRPNPRVRDEVAVEIVKRLNVDMGKYDKFMSHEGVIARTVMLDEMVRGFVGEHSDGVIVNLGAGLDNRFARVDNGLITWIDVDFENMIVARRKVYGERERVKMLSSSVLDD